MCEYWCLVAVASIVVARFPKRRCESQPGLVASLARETEIKPISGLILLGGARTFPEGIGSWVLTTFGLGL